MPITAEIEEIRSFIDPVMVMLPDPDPACIDELTFRSMDECLDAIAANTSAESVLAGLEGIYTLKNGEVINTEKLYNYRYRAIQGVVHIGTGSPDLPKPSL